MDYVICITYLKTKLVLHCFKKNNIFMLVLGNSGFVADYHLLGPVYLVAS